MLAVLPVSNFRASERLSDYLTWAEFQRPYRLTTDWERLRNDAPAFNVAPTDQVQFITRGENEPPIGNGRPACIP